MSAKNRGRSLVANLNERTWFPNRCAHHFTAIRIHQQVHFTMHRLRVPQLLQYKYRAIFSPANQFQRCRFARTQNDVLLL